MDWNELKSLKPDTIITNNNANTTGSGIEEFKVVKYDSETDTVVIKRMIITMGEPVRYYSICNHQAHFWSKVCK